MCQRQAKGINDGERGWIKQREGRRLGPDWSSQAQRWNMMEGLGSGAQWEWHFFFLRCSVKCESGLSQSSLRVCSGPKSGRETERPAVFISRERGRGIIFVFVCEERAVGIETLVIIRWGDVTVPNGSSCDCQCGHFLFSTCPTWLPLAHEI